MVYFFWTITIWCDLVEDFSDTLINTIWSVHYQFNRYSIASRRFIHFHFWRGFYDFAWCEWIRHYCSSKIRHRLGIFPKHVLKYLAMIFVCVLPFDVSPSSDFITKGCFGLILLIFLTASYILWFSFWLSMRGCIKLFTLAFSSCFLSHWISVGNGLSGLSLFNPWQLNVAYFVYFIVLL